MTQSLSKGEILHRLAMGDSLRGASLVRADLSGMDLTRVDLSQANLRMTNLSGANLSDAQLTSSFLSGALLNQSVLVGANLVQASLIGAMLKGADLSRADLSGADLTGTNLEKARLSGAYLVGAFLTEADLSGADLTSAFVRMAQLAGCTLSDAVFEGADLSHSDLSGARLEGASLVGANLTGARLTAGSLIGCDLREADLTNADLSGCNLTAAKLHGVTYSGVRLSDAWADWVNLSPDGATVARGTLEEVFLGILTKPIGQMLVEGAVPDNSWSILLSHLCDFQARHPDCADLQLKAIHKGSSSSALYLEAEREASIAVYFAELAEVVGRGADSLLEKLSLLNVSKNGHKAVPKEVLMNGGGAAGVIGLSPLDDPLGLGLALTPHADSMQRTSFWTSDKAFAILTGNRKIYLEASSNDSLTLRSPHNSTAGFDLVRGHFVADESRR